MPRFDVWSGTKATKPTLLLTPNDAESTNLSRLTQQFRFRQYRDGKDVFVEKYPEHVFHLEYLFACYPKAKAVCIVRDAREVASSIVNCTEFNEPWYGERGQKWECVREAAAAHNIPVPNRGHETALDKATVEWLAANASLLSALPSFSDQLLVISYADLLDRPADIAELVQNHFSLPYDRSYVEWVASNVKRRTKQYTASDRFDCDPLLTPVVHEMAQRLEAYLQ